MLGREAMLLRRTGLVARQPQVLSHQPGVLPAGAPRDRGRDAPVQQPPPRQPGLVVDQGAQLLVREVVGRLGSRKLSHHTVRDELLECAHRLLVASTTRLPNRLEIEGAPYGRRGPEHLAGHVAETSKPRLEQAAHLWGQRLLLPLTSRVQSREVLGHE